jgi:hypothetical protein
MVVLLAYACYSNRDQSKYVCNVGSIQLETCGTAALRQEGVTFSSSQLVPRASN